jgi:hypothetical protein
MNDDDENIQINDYSSMIQSRNSILRSGQVAGNVYSVMSMHGNSALRSPTRDLKYNESTPYLQQNNTTHSQSSLSLAIESNRSRLKQYNQQIMEQQKKQPFLSHNIANELINKPVYRLTKLTNAESLRPYLNPNLASSAEQIQALSRGLKAQKYLPVFHSKEDNKLKSFLPSIQPVDRSESLIRQQMQDERLYYEIEKKHLQEF